MSSPHPDPEHIHFVGICGTAMAAVAVLLKERGHPVTGSDQNVYPPMSTFLEKMDIPIQSGFDPSHLSPPPDRVVIGNAISRGNPELESVLDAKIPYLSLPECLKHFFLQGKRNLVVTGTHGKTTTASLLAWLLDYAGQEPSFFIGGIPLNFDSGCRQRDSSLWVLEGDEYDSAFSDKRSKFLHYLPEMVLINNIEFDHADIFSSLEDIQKCFRLLLRLVPGNGMVVVNGDDPHIRPILDECTAPILEVGLNPDAAIRIEPGEVDEHGSHFDLLEQHFHLPLYGEHNIRNAAMAVTAAHQYHIPLKTLAEGLQRFAGIKRRLEVRGQPHGITVIDDFGHHPSAIRETLRALRLRYPSRRIWALFEPRSNTTRRAVFQDPLAQALAGADAVRIGPVARIDQLPPENRLDPGKLAADISLQGVPARYIEKVDELIASILPDLAPDDVVVVLSNGSFDGLIDKLLARLDPPSRE